MVATGAMVAEAADAVGAAVVGIGRGGRGSGFVIAPGVVVTNAHNVRGREVTVAFQDGRRATGTVAGTDEDGDLAVVQVDTGAAEPATWGDGGALGLGDGVVALAAPDGHLRATAGAIAGLDATIRTRSGRPVTGAVEHTAPLASGSSGGPLVDRSGAVVGIDTNRVPGGLYQALPVTATLRERVAALGRGESVDRPRLGVVLAPVGVGARLRAAVGLDARDGLLVHDVEPDGPAARAGIARGDLLVRASDRDLRHPDDLHAVLNTGGGQLSLQVVRGETERTVEIDLPTAGAGDA